MKKFLFFIYLMLFACVFANAQTVSDQLEKAKNDYLFGNGVYSAGAGTEQEYTVDFWCGFENLYIPQGTTAIIKVSTFPILPNDIIFYNYCLDNTFERLSDGDYVFQIRYTAENITSTDAFRLKYSYDDLDVHLYVTAPQKKDFTGVYNFLNKITKESTIDLGSRIKLSVTDADVIRVTNDKYNVNFEQESGNLVLNQVNLDEYERNLTRASGYGKTKVIVSADGYNDFVFYAEYKKDFTVTDPNGKTMANGETFTLTDAMKGQDINLTVENVAAYSPLTVEGESPVTGPTFDYNKKPGYKIGKFKLKDPAVDGKLQITFSAEGYNDFVCYLEYTAPVVPVEKIKLSRTSGTLEVGQTGQLTATVLPENATNKEVIWKSKDESIATVDQNGLVTAVAPGTTYIGAFSKENENIYAVCKIKVKNISVKKIKLSKTSGTLYVGQTGQLTATVLPEDAFNKEIIWKSQDESVAAVDQNGLVTGVSEGTVYIGAFSAENEKIYATCKVKVKNVPVKKIKLSRTSGTLYVGKTGQLTATVFPEDATDKEVIWKSQDESIATVDQNGLVTGVSEGTVYIGAFSKENPKIYARCKITVKNR